MRAPAAVLRRPVDATARLRAALAPGPRLRRRLIVVAALVALFAGLYMLWLRDSSFVAVEEVTVTGLTSRDADRVRAALTSTAETMTTLHVDEERLRETAAVFPVVAAIEVTPDFPNGLEVRVIEHRKVAILDAGGRRVPVAGDGSVLAGLPAEGDLPTIELSGAVPQRELPPGAARDSARVAGGAPPVISRRLESVGREGGARGVVVKVEAGPEIVFGIADRVAAKWAAAVRVLADGEAEGAAYIDVRIPERPVAGGLLVETVAPVAPVDETTADPSLSPADPATSAPSDGAVAVPTPTPDPVAPAPQSTPPPAATDTGGGAAP